MTDLETRLREHLHDRLDPLQSGSLLPAQALRAGRRGQRRRHVVIATALAVALVGGGAGAVAVSDREDRAVLVPASGLTDRTVEYARQIANGEYALLRGDMTPTTRADLTEERFGEVWAKVVKALGPYQGAGRAVLESKRPWPTVRVPLRFRDGAADLRVTYDEEGAVIGVTLLTGTGTPISTPPELERAARAIVAELAAGRFDRVGGRFDEQMARAVPEASLRAAWQSVAIDRYDGLTRVLTISATSVGAATVLDVLCEMRRGTLKVRVSFDEEGLVNGLFLLAT